MTKARRIQRLRYLAPRITKRAYEVNGTMKTVRVVRSSKIAEFFNRDFVVIGRTVYIRSRILTRHLWATVFGEIEECDRVGLIKYLWSRWA